MQIFNESPLFQAMDIILQKQTMKGLRSVELDPTS